MVNVCESDTVHKNLSTYYEKNYQKKNKKLKDNMIYFESSMVFNERGKEKAGSSASCSKRGSIK